MNIKILSEKFSNEHRIAWDKLVEIERNDDDVIKAKQILKLFYTELQPHFKQEENTILSIPEFTNHPSRIKILKEHQQVYNIISELENEIDIKKNLTKFFPLMYSHIKLEDEFFNSDEILKSNKKNYYFIFLAFIFLLIFLIFFFWGGRKSLTT